MENNLKKMVADNRNYIIIAILSVAAVFFLPFLGTSIGLGFAIPNTAAGWVVYVITKLCIVVINLLIFDQFMKRAKVNASASPYFQEAEQILRTHSPDDEPILPAATYIRSMYRSKMISTAIFTVLGVFGFTNAILTFDWVAMLSYIFTILMGLVFGWISMSEAEVIWIEKHYKYAKQVEREKAEEAKRKAKLEEGLALAAAELAKQANDTADNTGGTPILVSPNNNGTGGSPL